MRTISVQKAAQTGVSESVNCVLGFLIEHQPTPMLVIHPTSSAAEAFSKERLADMIATTPALRRRVTDKRLPATDGRPESTLALKMFPGGFLALGGANSANSFARWSVRLAVGDDVDRFPPTVGVEGDPADLLRNRTLSFHDGLTVFVSTPTVKRGRIDSLFTRSDQRRWVVPCLACGQATWVTWTDAGHWWVRYDDGDPATARLQCPRCDASVAESERAAWVARGAWQTTTTAADPGAIGFHLPSMLSPFMTLPRLVARWREAQDRGRESLRGFINTALGESWEDEDRTITIGSSGGLMDQREAYDEVPHVASLITGAVDVQDDRFEALFCAWGPREECWVLAHEVLTRDAGYDPYDGTSWERLYLALREARFDHASGVKLPIHTICIDSGFQTMSAYRFSRFARGSIFCTKGVASLQDGHFVKYSEDKDSASSVRRAVPLLLVNTDVGKQRVADRVRARRIHFPVAKWAEDEFFAQLTAETCEPIFNPAGVRVGQKWVKQRARNEILDLLVLNFAAREIRATLNLEAYRASVGLAP